MNDAEDIRIPLLFFSELIKDHRKIVDVLRRKIEEAEF
jgi:hypothetical protein